MKAVLIHGQNHKGASYNIGKKLLESLNEVNVINEFFLPCDMDEFCIGCYTCLTKDEDRCPHENLIAPITKAIEEADLLVFTTPVYCMRTTGSMKALLDHYFSRWMNHRPKAYMFNKKAVVISVGAGGGMKKAAKDIVTSLDNWGISHIRTFHAATYAMKWDEVTDKRKDKILRSLDRYTRKAIVMMTRNNVRMGKKFHFYCMRFMHKRNWSLTHDKEYWESMGWLGQRRPWREPSES